MPENTMVVGADVTHPQGLGDQDSIVAVCATMDANCARYEAKTSQAESRCETIVDMKNIMSEKLERYKELNGHLPEKIIVYRDGLGAGQFQMAMATEYANLELAASNVA